MTIEPRVLFLAGLAILGSTSPALAGGTLRIADLKAGKLTNSRLSNELSPVDTPASRFTVHLKPMAGRALRFNGLQANAALKLDRLAVSANYTFSRPWNMQQDVRHAVRHQANLDLSAPLSRRLEADLRVSYDGARQTAATLLNASLRLEELLPGLPGTDLQLGVDNLTDQRVDDLSIRQAGGVTNTSPVLQPRRAFYLRLSTRF